MEKSVEISDHGANAIGRARLALSVLAAFALGQAIFANGGEWDSLGIAWLGLGIVLVIAAVRSSPTTTRLFSRISPSWLFGFCFAVQLAQLWLWIVRNAGARLHVFIVPMIVAAIGAAIVIFAGRWRQVGLAGLILGHALAGFLAIRQLPAPFIDVWDFQQDASAALLHGQNPYEVRLKNIYESKVLYGPGTVVDGYLTLRYPYPPLTLLMTAPAKMLGDVRWADLIALEAAAIFIALAWPTQNGVRAAAMILLNPCSLYLVYSAWTESLMLPLFAAMLFCSIRKPKLLWLPLGLFIASKQYAPFVAPLALMLLPRPIDRRAAIALLVKSFALAVAITLPFMLWNPIAFLHGPLLTQVNAPMRMDGLTMTVLVVKLTGLHLPGVVGLLAMVAAGFWAWKRSPRNAAGFSLAAALALVMFFAFTKQAFCNYYFLVGGMLCCAAAGVTDRSAQVVREKNEDDSVVSNELAMA